MYAYKYATVLNKYNYSCCITSYTNKLVVFFLLLGCTETAKGDKTLIT